MNFEYGGVIGLIVLALAIWAFINILQSGAGTGSNVLWILLILFLPIIGFVIWLLAGPRKA